MANSRNSATVTGCKSIQNPSTLIDLTGLSSGYPGSSEPMLHVPPGTQTMPGFGGAPGELVTTNVRLVYSTSGQRRAHISAARDSRKQREYATGVTRSWRGPTRAALPQHLL